jgi:UDP:flavonoid glycosyltransferase YjiC (YdhE family)
VARLLFHSLPLVGHVHPIAAVARAAAVQGHDVAWVGSEAFLRPRVGPDATVFPTGTRLYRGLRRDFGLASLKSRWEGYIVPQARFTLAAVERAIADYRPDVLAVDQHALAGALAAHRTGVRWATLAPTTAELARPHRTLPTVEAWVDGLMTTLWTKAGRPGPPPHDLRYSPHLVVAFTIEALIAASVPSQVRFVGAATGPRPGVAFAWDALDPRRRRVLVTVGTLGQDMAADFLRRTVAAVDPVGDRVQAIIVSEEPLDAPAHVLVVPQVPMLDLLPHLDAVVSHGGLNTVCEALSHGVPLVVAPIRGDQPVNAHQVAATGAGLRVRFDRDPPERLRAAILSVLDDARYRRAALRLRESFAAAGGATTAANLLGGLAGMDD